MSPVLTDETSEALWARLESWLARKRWTPQEAVGLLAGHYPDADSSVLEFVPNGRPRGWKGKSASDVAALAIELRQSLLDHLKLLSPKREVKSMPPARWIELAALARRVPAWLQPGRIHPRLAHYLPPVGQLRRKPSLAGKGRPRGRTSTKRKEAATNENRLRADRSDAGAAKVRPLDRWSIHEWTYLDPKTVERILAAPGSRVKLAIPDENREALRLTLRDITFELLHQSYGEEPTREAVKQVRQTYERFIGAVEALRGLAYPAPPPPREWQSNLLQWLKAEEGFLASRKKGGAPIKRWDRFAYPRLLGFYEFAFGRPPASTNAGPTWKFVAFYLRGVNRSLANTHFKIRSEKAHILRVWKVPKPAGLAWKIRAAEPNAVAKMYFDLHKAARHAGRTADIAKTDSD